MRVDHYTGPAPQPPPYPARYGRNLLSAVVLAVVFGYAAQVVELRPLELLRDIGNIGVFLKGYLHPSLAHLRAYAWQCRDYRGTIEALKFKKAEIGHLGPKAYVEATNDNYANVEPVVQVRNANGSLGYRSCLIVHADSDIFNPEDIGGKTFAFNDPNSTSGYLVPMTMFLNEMGINPKQHFSKLTFSGSHEASILAVLHKKVEVASTNLTDVQQLTREGKVPRGALRIIWVSKLTPNDPIVVRKDLPDSLRQAIQDTLVAMQEKHPEAFAAGGAFIGSFQKVDDAEYQVICELNETSKRLVAQQ